jgi:multiple sugar transport system substrate-binding protein
MHVNRFTRDSCWQTGGPVTPLIQRGKESPDDSFVIRRAARRRLHRRRGACGPGLAACGGGSKAGAGSKTITVLSSFTTGNATGDEWNKLMKQFTDQTGIAVQTEEVNGNDLAKGYEAAVLAGKEKDIVILNLTPDTSDWLPNGQVVNVRKYLDNWGLTDKIEPKAIEYWTQGDKGVAGFPFIGFNWPVWYNRDLLTKAGVSEVPKTTDDLIAAAGKLRAAGIQPMALGGAEWPVGNFTYWMIQQYVRPDEAQQLFSKGGFCASPAAVKGLDLFARLRDAGVFIDHAQGHTADQMTTAYFNRKAAMMPSGSWAYSNATPAMAESTTLAGFPVTPDGVYTKPTAFNGYSAGFFLSKNGAKKIDAVEKLMKFMYSQPVLQSWVADGSQILDVKPTVLGAVTAKNALVVKGNEVTKEKVDFLFLPDAVIPAGLDYGPPGSEFIGHKGETGAQYRKALDKLYAQKK